MKLIKKSIKEFEGSLISTYDFDRLRTVQDFWEVIRILIDAGVQIEFVKASEYGDYDDDKQIIIYKNLEKLEQIEIDFANKTIETFNIVGKIEDCNIHATIYTHNNRMRISYMPPIKEKLENISNKFSR